jgi:hypothetical protein
MDAAARLLEDIAFEKAWPYPLVQGIKKAAHERTMEDHAIHVNGLARVYYLLNKYAGNFS